jgi:hypothetical protein
LRIGGKAMVNGRGPLSVCQGFFLAMLLWSNVTHAQVGPGTSKGIDEFLSGFPAGFELEEDGPQEYRIHSHLHNRDISGKMIKEILITAEFTRALDEGYVRWSNVRIGASQDPAEPVSESMLHKSFANPVVVMTGDVSITGRSLYWGSMWISLEDRQIEYGTLNEEVMMEMTFKGDSGKQLVDMQREVVFEKKR